MTCPRLEAELVHVSKTHHATDEDIARRVRDHEMACPECRGWAVPPHTPREREG